MKNNTEEKNMQAQKIQTLEDTLTMSTWQEPVTPLFPERPSPTFPEMPKNDYGRPFGYGPLFYLGGANVIFPNMPNSIVIPHDKLPGGGDIHDTFKYDRYGNLYNGHTTIQWPGGKDKL